MREWLTIAENLALEHTARHDCPECGAGTNTNAAIISHRTRGYSIHCFACDYNDFESKGQLTLTELKRIAELNEQAQEPITQLELPHDYTTDIPRHGRLWLYKGGITETTWKKYRIGYSELYDRVVLPVFDSEDNLIWFQCRALYKEQTPKYLQPSRDKSGVLFRARGCTESTRNAVIVEDILSAIRVGRHISTYSLLGTKINTGQENVLSKHKSITTWLDSDRAGRRGAAKIRKSLGLVCETSNIVTECDPKELSDHEIKKILAGVGVL
jgi:DNA primase